MCIFLFLLKCGRNWSSLQYFFMLDHAKSMVNMSCNHGVTRYLRICCVKTKTNLVFLGVKIWEQLVITLELLHAGPCKAHGRHVLQQQGYRKSHIIYQQNLFYEKTKMNIVFILIKMSEKLVITFMFLHAGPYKAQGCHVLQPQGFPRLLISYRKYHNNILNKQDLFYEKTKMHIVFILI